MTLPGAFASRPSSMRGSRIRTRRPRCGASLVEIIITLVILGMLAALVIPKFSRAAPGSRPDLRDQLTRLRVAIELYRNDHGRYPGRVHGRSGAADAQTFAAQLTQYSDDDGATSPTYTARFRHGPYLRGQIPPLAAPGGAAGVWLLTGHEVPNYRPQPDIGWVYNCDTGDIAANSNARDESGVRLDTY